MIKIGEWLFDPSARQLLLGQEERRLSPKAAGVLSALAEMPGQVWSRDALLERVWPAVTVGEEVLTHAIAELRKALGDDFRAPRYVKTVHKSGYRLMGAHHVAVVEPGGVSDDFDLATYASYLEACKLYERGGRGNMAMAVAEFAQIVETHPSFALAHAGLAKSLTFLGTYYEARLSDLDRALDHTRKAQRIAPRLAEAYAVEGLIFAIAGDKGRGEAQLKTAITLAPDSGEIHYLLGRACLSELNFDLAGVALERAAQLRGDDYHSLVMAGKVRRHTGDTPQSRINYLLALPRIETRLMADPDDCRALCAKARCYWQLGMLDEAAGLMDRVAAHHDPMNYHLACTMARAGENRRAMDVLEEVVDIGWRHRAWLDRDPDFDTLRDDRRFKRIARSIGEA